MTRPELDAFTDALARLHGKKPAGQSSSRTVRTVKSRRKKKSRRS